MNLKRNITFHLESRKKDGVLVTENVPIRMRVVFDGKRIEFTTGYRIDAAKWDASKQRVKNGCTNKLKQSSSEINADLNRYEGEIQNIFKEFELREIMPLPEQVKNNSMPVLPSHVLRHRLRRQSRRGPFGICMMNLPRRWAERMTGLLPPMKNSRH